MITTDLARPGAMAEVIDPATAVVFHLAAVVSAAAGADVDLGMAVNLKATMTLSATCRALPEPPRLVFASSVAAYGKRRPRPIGAAPLKARPAS